ncbi:DNA mismatch repair protein MutL [Flavobacterium branchiophilum NBRC 15030 = ATCC 35035]|uniref:DNA mismatch repair protein MutL n=1 Tax=Flavobacterium branchiophilum TaxID=55197 RepID=A0A543G663_9FLAO|nr:DNA mismatch repair endonuclease MutL [Flavobacterium branchiophilum]OXA80213.1 DNA mismatch repair protein MutL [Flavobacterium branchiophilum NBRC 15030 = ATCC 35035]TQM41573.1 DNA mismatch repair protein MutL [Flavobacterium branchiophilum]GEM56435.1 DNA mismatch repair protein MutL [Flavobacterium branchiophilum NBRC 15030 = ATCC 35035]
MSSVIQLLPDHVANQIAAGEVVQRPASVVKELLENAVDAKASDIKLIIKEAGKTLIQVVDNGQGMNVTDARMCFERHATSKIRLAEDLFSLHTKGFRGEALASIAAIAHVELKTKPDQNELGTHIIIEGSKFIAQESAVLPIGTSFAVKNLFFNIPARRNFLKSDVIEHRHIVDEFQRVAMAHPNIHFSFFHNGSELYNLPKSNLRQRIVNIFAGKTNEKLVPIIEDTEIVCLQGFVAKPEYAKKSKNEQFFFVNNRYIKSGYLHHAVMSAFDGLLPNGAQPSYFIYLEVPPHSIDINIHPTKTEIKFDDEKALYAILRSAIKHSLGQFNVSPILDFERDANLDTPYHYKDLEAQIPTVEIDSNYNPFQNSNKTQPLLPLKRQVAANWESLYIGTTEQAFDSHAMLYEEEEVAASLFDEDIAEKSLQLTYQLNKKYIISPLKSGMVIVDQQRAHQRILYEEFLSNMTVNQAASQQLLFPLNLFYSTNELTILSEVKLALQHSGFLFDENVTDSVVILGLPVNVSESEASIVLEQLLQDMQNEIPENSFSQNDMIAKSMSKSLGIKTGKYLTEKEQENIINMLFACKEPNMSPFNKPTYITMRVEDIDKKF